MKAGFLYNFAKFTEWPPEPSTSPITFCVGDSAVAEALRTVTNNRVIAQRPLSVLRVNVDDLHADCSVLYLSNLDAKRAARVVAGLRGASVLSVSDFVDFCKVGGIIRFVHDGPQLRLEINVSAAERSRLRLSSQLLGVATLYREAVP